MAGFLSTGRPAGEPAVVLVLRAVIAVLSLAVLGLAAFAISVSHAIATSLDQDGYAYTGYNGTAVLLIFVVVKTLLIYGLLTWLELRHPGGFARPLAVLAWIVSAVFWLAAWGWAASIASAWLQAVCEDGVDGDGSGCAELRSNSNKEGAALAACAGIGALIWILCIIHLVIFFRACIRESKTPSQTELDQLSGHGKDNSIAFVPAPPYQQSQPIQQPPAYSQ